MEKEILIELQEIRQLLSKQNLLKKEVLDLGEACEYLNVSPSYLYKLTANDSIVHYCPTGKKLFFQRHQLDEFILQNRQSTNAEMEQAATEYITYGKGGRKA